jgi:hypothetical protein
MASHSKPTGRSGDVPSRICGCNCCLSLRLSRSATLLGTVAIVLLDVGLHCVFELVSSVNYMAHRDVGRMCRGFVAPSLVMLAASS